MRPWSIVLLLLGAVCWAVPGAVLGALIRVGLLADDGETATNVVIIATYFRIAGAGQWLCLLGVILLAALARKQPERSRSVTARRAARPLRR